MKLIKMSYKGFGFDVNPASLEISLSKSISTRGIPFSFSKSQEINIQPTKIKGSGKFIGENARQKAYQLERVFKSKGSSYLFVPDASPMKAFFSELNISYDSKDNSVSYSFEFIEDSNSKETEYSFGYTIASSNENLYDISNRTGIDVAKLFDMNDYKDLFSVKDGDKVWLC